MDYACRNMKRASLLFAFAFILSACGGAASAPSAAPSSAPPASAAAKPASAPASAPAASAKPAASAPASANAAAKPDASASAAPAASGLTKVTYGALSFSLSDAGIILAQEKGWFKDQGIDLDLQPFDSGARMVPPLGANQLDAGGGAPSAGLNSAVARDVKVLIVADKGKNAPGRSFTAMIVRKDLVDSGKVKTPADFKGMKIALTSTAIPHEMSLAAILKSGGLTLKDVDALPLAFPDQVKALANKSIDASVTTEPFIQDILAKDVGVVFKRMDEFIPNQQTAVVMFSPKFASNTDLATRWMVAYVKGVRMFNDAFTKKIPAARDEAVDLLVKRTDLKDKAGYDKAVMPGIDPDGKLNVDDLKAQQDFYIAQGEQKDRIDVEKTVDASLTEAAVKTLGGPYK